MHNLVACAVVHNEESYLLEWIFFHTLQGIEHFFLYEGNSTDNTLGVLRALEKAGLATVHSDSKYTIQYQMGAYNEYLREHGKESTWTAFIDIDEMLFSPQGQILPILNQCQGSALAVYWQVFGSNSELHKRPELVIERFTKREAKVGTHCKSVVFNAETISASGNPHAFILQDYACDENNKILPKNYAITEGGTAEKIRIAHYHTKSFEEYQRRKMLQHGYHEMVRRFEGHDKNEVEDLSLKEQAPTVKSLIEQFKYG